MDAFDNKKIEDFRNTIWTTRICRVNAESRLISKNNFIEGINIYYSCVVICLSVLSINYKFKLLEYFNILMTIILLISILYLKSLDFASKANEYKHNYTELHKLELKLVDNIKEDEYAEIEKKYCDLLSMSANHISFDYYVTVIENMRCNFKEQEKNKVRGKYIYGKLWRNILKVLIIVFPIAAIMGIIIFGGCNAT